MLRHGPHVRRHEPIRLPTWQQWCVYVAVGLLLASGIAWLVLHYALQVQTDFGARPHPLEYQSLRIHGAAAMLILIVLGSLMPVHIRRAWELRKNIASGIAMLAVLAALVATGYLLYYFVGERTRPWIGTLHWVLGLVLLPGLCWHVRAGQQRQRAAERSEDIEGADARVT